MQSSQTTPFDASTVTRPDRSLLTYYIFVSLATGPGAPFVFIPLWLRYLTLNYKFDEEGVSMSWGILFRREIYLTYRRLQDIHLTRNVVERWMGLSKIALQTASGSSSAEMTIEGVLQTDELRDFLYAKMRGSKDRRLPIGDSEAVASNAAGFASTQVGGDRATALLEEIRDALQKIVNQQKA